MLTADETTPGRGRGSRGLRAGAQPPPRRGPRRAASASARPPALDEADPSSAEEDLHDAAMHAAIPTQGGSAVRGRGGRGRGRQASASRADSINIGKVLTAKDGTEWECIRTGQENVGRRPQQNILREIPGPTALARRSVDCESPLSAWRLFIDDFILKKIKECTEKEARRVLENTTWTISIEELEAFISILYARGVMGLAQFDLQSMWSKSWGLPIAGKIMGRNRFVEIMRFLRFDDKSTRLQRLVDDKFAMVSEIWDRFISNCQSHYKPSENITVDEQLFPSKARCPFTQYMANKPDKFGQKFWMASDV